MQAFDQKSSSTKDFLQHTNEFKMCLKTENKGLPSYNTLSKLILIKNLE